jgi:hypothetical protein
MKDMSGRRRVPVGQFVLILQKLMEAGTQVGILPCPPCLCLIQTPQETTELFDADRDHSFWSACLYCHGIPRFAVSEHRRLLLAASAGVNCLSEGAGRCFGPGTPSNGFSATQ